LKGQKVSTSEELTKSNFMLLKKLQEHNLIDQAWSLTERELGIQAMKQIKYKH
jgi:hypothetical protein